ncbi:MAG: hypothetical protein OCC46_06630 [Pseudodesulfovibrio sp.]
MIKAVSLDTSDLNPGDLNPTALSRFLAEWLTQHILKTDMDLGSYLLRINEISPRPFRHF